MEMKVLLVDSDQRLLDELAVMLHAFQCFRVVGTARTSTEAVEYVQSNDVDVVFASHQPADPRTTSVGEHLSAVLGQSHPHIQVVVYSGSEEWAFNAYRCQCAGYLLTPFDPWHSSPLSIGCAIFLICSRPSGRRRIAAS